MAEYIALGYITLGLIFGFVMLFFINGNAREMGRTSGFPPELVCIFLVPVLWGLLVPAISIEIIKQKLKERKYCTNNNKEHNFDQAKERFYMHEYHDIGHYLSCSDCAFVKQLDRTEARELHNQVWSKKV